MPASEIDLEHRSDVSVDDGESSCSSNFWSANGGSDSMVEIDLESGTSGSSGVFQNSEERNCRICHMGLESSSHEFGIPTQLGCACKDDLCFVHKQCAETWFKIKGNTRCEICLSVARNFAGENEAGPPAERHRDRDGVVNGEESSEALGYWRGNRFMNLLVTCLVCAFVLTWFFDVFHLNTTSQ